MELMTQDLQERFRSVGEQFSSVDPIIVAKYFDPVGSATWYATEYNPENEVFYGYVTGLIVDEWGTFSLPELESVQLPFGMGIERDLHFKEKRFSEQFKDTYHERTLELEQENSDDYEHEI